MMNDDKDDKVRKAFKLFLNGVKPLDLVLNHDFTPDEAIEAARKAALTILKMKQPKHYEEVSEIYVHFSYPAGYALKLREISAQYINKLISLKGLLTRTSQVYPMISKATFKCNTCGMVYKIPQSGLKLRKPNECVSDVCKGKKRSFT